MPGAVAVVVFTSGTTGRPRGACLTRDNLYWSAVASAARLGSTSEDRWLACLPLFHVGGLSILVRSVLYGTAVVVQERFDPARVGRALDEEGITLLSLVPTTLKRLLEARPGRAPDRLRAVLLGGAAAPEGLVRRARDRGYPVLPTYGLTEAASQVATVRPGAEPRGVGAPLVGTSVRVVDERGHRLPPEGAGALEVRGPTVFAGYLEDPEATRARRSLRGRARRRPRRGAARPLLPGAPGRLQASARDPLRHGAPAQRHGKGGAGVARRLRGPARGSVPRAGRRLRGACAGREVRSGGSAAAPRVAQDGLKIESLSR